MKKVVFLDRDGTLVHDVGYTHKVDDYRLLPSVKEGLQKLQAAGYSLVILTSQSGIARGMYTEEDYEKYTDEMLRDLRNSGINIEGICYCPHHAEGAIEEYKKVCECRKPKPGLVLQAEEKFGPFDYKKSWVIGNRPRDIESAKNASQDIKGIMVTTNQGTPEAEEIKEEEKSGADFTADTFLQAVEIILQNK